MLRRLLIPIQPAWLKDFNFVKGDNEFFHSSRNDVR